ncbi:DUF1269 domain-containing protein [Rhodobacter sphaeroides]|uniref:DUF1269 domain-containing protein n=1 Tax=Cereibacter sphaeroides TaxID=1063 RepID=UPI00132A9947|nr:DUF1269 domain-containing protein [Cereibacter sphaeroides]MWP38474.1 DUF1269 domain-containing protein [Cereibacter sphaeroides]
MSEFIVLAFNDTTLADETLSKLNRMQKEYLVDLEDAVVAIRDPEGKVHLKQSVNLVGVSAASSGLSGALWGGLIGLLFLNPLAGMAVGGAVGAGSGALAGRLIDYGIDDILIKEIANTVTPGTSALFLLVRKGQPDKVLAELSGINAKIIRSSLTPDQETQIEAALRAASGA